MKRGITLLTFFTAFCATAMAQGVGINTNTPDASAVLDLVSNSQGLLMPRMTKVERDAISNPANGLMIYNTDCGIFDYYNGSSWKSLGGNLGQTGGISGPSSACLSETGVAYSLSAVQGATNYSWTVPSGASVASGQGTNSVTVDFGTSSGSVCVTPSDSCSVGQQTCVAVAVASCCTPNTWTQQNNFGPGSRKSAVAFVINGKAYVGTGDDGSVKKDFWEYDPATDIWTQKADFGGVARNQAMGFAINGKGYIGGGRNGGTLYQDFWEYDPGTNTWTQRADFGGGGRALGVGFSVNGKGYMGTGLSGSGGTYNKDLWEYDPSGNSWTQKADFDHNIRASIAFVVGSKAYVGLGWTGSGYQNDLWEYDPSGNSWASKASFPNGAREQAMGLAIGSYGYLVGGSDCCAYYKDFWQYDSGTNSWTQKANLGGTERSVAFTFSVGSSGYVGGGYDNTVLQDVWEYCQ